MTLTILAKPSADLDRARAWARQRDAKRLAEVDKYLAELWRLAPKFGIDPAVAAAQSSEETGAWTSDVWDSGLNPAGMFDASRSYYQDFRTGTEAAQAQLAHLAIYAKGWRGAQQAIRYLHLDERWHAPFDAGYAGKAKTVADLAGTWAEDPNYGTKIEEHHKGIREAIVKPGPTPGTDPPAGIIYKATGNWFPRAPVEAPVALVYHITDDLKLENTISWFLNPASQASSHFVIARDGTVYQFVGTLNAAWTNGDVNRPRTDIGWLNRAVDSGVNINKYTITIEHVGTPNDPPTEAQYRASTALSKYAIARYGIKANRAHMMRHADINSVSRPYCPGPRFDLARIIRDCGGDPADMSD